MTSVISVLRRHATSTLAPTLGGPRSGAGISRDALANDLLAVSRRNTTYFRTCFAAVLLVLAGAAFVTLRYLDSPDVIRAIFGVLGISVSALTVQLTSLWKQKVSADLLLVLARNIDEAQLKTVIDTLLAKL
jgi:hypothetical protein